MNRNVKDIIARTLIWGSAAITASMLLIIVGFIISNGWRLINWDFLTRDANDTLRIVHVDTTITNIRAEDDDLIIDGLGLTLRKVDDYGIKIINVERDSPAKNAKDNAGEVFRIRNGQVLEGFGSSRLNANTELTDVAEIINAHDGIITMRVRQLGGGIFPMLVSTLLLIIVTLTIATPIAVLAAIYMTEYAKQGRIVSTIRFAIEILAGLPSVVHGLFGMLFFVRLLGLGTSLLSGGLTMTILLLPIMIRSTEEALKTVPNSYREASLGLGANKIQTIRKVILPSAIPGITIGIILSIGRIVGESAALLFTVGTFARLPINPASGNLSIFETGATMTLRAFIEVQEFGNIEKASAIGIVILVIVFGLNMLSKIVSKKFNKAV